MIGQEKLIKGLDNPASAAIHLYKKARNRLSGQGPLDVQRYREGYLSLLFTYSTIAQDDVDQYVDEIQANPRLRAAHRRLRTEFGQRKLISPRCVALYILVRSTKPNWCVETGTRHGESSVFILEALEENGNGTLTTIDLPSPRLPPAREPGWIVPEQSRSRWTLIAGRSQDHLEQTLTDGDDLGLFFHDSYHKYPLMKWEFDTVLNEMSDGIIASHDINRNHAYLELCTKADSPVNVVEPFKIGGSGLFGYAVVGDAMQREAVKTAEMREI